MQQEPNKAMDKCFALNFKTKKKSSTKLCLSANKISRIANNLGLRAYEFSLSANITSLIASPFSQRTNKISLLVNNLKPWSL